ncbi:MAG TPA: hypothetical protein VFD38_02590 [Myxococcaceae bacterium]|nr:hypothetical protein [Myxococcaceae bacterium]
MKRPLLQLASVILAGRHCHPLGLLLAGLLFVTLGSGAVGSGSASGSLALPWRNLHGSVNAHAPGSTES